MNGGGIRWRSFLIRLARIGGAALLITGATWFAFPQSYIFFGILHCIALSSVLALPFLFVPAPLVALAAALVIAAPTSCRTPCSTRRPCSSSASVAAAADQRLRPLVPWLASCSRGSPPRGSRRRRWRGRGSDAGGRKRARRASRPAGRHSFAIYLVRPAPAAGAADGAGRTHRSPPAGGSVRVPRRVPGELCAHRRRGRGLPHRGPLRVRRSCAAKAYGRRASGASPSATVRGRRVSPTPATRPRKGPPRRRDRRSTVESSRQDARSASRV